MRSGSHGASVALLLVTVALLAGCGAGDVPEVEWWFDLGEDTAVHVVVPEQERGFERGELELDLLLYSTTDPNYQFGGQPLMVDTDADERIYVLDMAASEVRAYDTTGEYLRTIGRPGQGPGELSSPVSLLVEADTIAVTDSVSSRLTRWRTTGELLETVSLEGMPFFQLLGSTPRGSWLGLHFSIVEGGRRGTSIVEVDATGEVQGTVIEFPRHPQVQLPRGVPMAGILEIYSRLATPTNSYEFLPPDRVAITPGSEFQVGAISPAGDVVWASAVALQRSPIPSGDQEDILRSIRETAPTFVPDPNTWPTHFPAYSRISVDGYGNVVAFRFAPQSSRDDVVAVDVFDAAGGHIGSATLPDIRWLHASGEFVYALTTDPDSLERGIGRYRLRAPWINS